MTKVEQKRSKFLYIVLTVILSTIAVVGISAAFLLNYNTYAPNSPLVLDDGQNIYISTSLNDNYKGYRFKFVDENNKETIIDSEKNQLTTDELLENKLVLGQTYKISVCYLAENVGNNSEYSKKISWKFQKYLDMPDIRYDSYNSLLSWQSVDNADFYRIYISGEEDYIEVYETSYNIQSLDGGEKTINVTSHSNNENYLTSNKSNSLNITLIHYLNSFTSIDFDSSTNIITAKSNSEYQKINIYLNETCYESNLFHLEKSGEEFIYKIDITTIYNKEEKIGICPSSIDEYKLYRGEILYFHQENL